MKTLITAVVFGLGFASATGVSDAATAADENLVVDVELTGAAARGPIPLGESASGRVAITFPNFTRDSMYLTNLEAELLVNGVATGQGFTVTDYPRMILGRSPERFLFKVQQPGNYSVRVFGDYAYYVPDQIDFERRTVNVTVPILQVAAGLEPQATKFVKAKGPRKLAFTKEDYRYYKYRIFLRDPSHALDIAKVEDVYIPQERWKRTKSGWVVPYIKEVPPASPYEFKRLPSVYNYRMTVYAADDDLEAWQSRRANQVLGSFTVTFRK